MAGLALFVNSGFSKPQVELRGGVIRVRCGIVNRTKAGWRLEEGWAIGYQLFDQPTRTLLVDGARTPLELAPAEEKPMALDVVLPSEAGEYDIYVSPMQENVAWFYDRGWPFLLVRASVNELGETRLLGWQVIRKSALVWRSLGRRLRRSLTLPVESAVRNRNLIRTLVRRDVLSRYSGSFGGALWAVLNPLLLMLTYFFVFGVVLRARLGQDPSRASFAVYFLAGMLPWLAFSEAAGRAPTVLIEHRNFIKKLVFPVEILPVNLMVSGLVTEFFGLILFLLALLIVRGRLPITLIYLPALIVPQILFTAGICWFLSALGVFVRDLAQINGFLLTIWFFITPICYPDTSLPQAAIGLVSKNPIYILVRGYRAILLESHAPDWKSLVPMTAVSLFVFFAGHAWFYKLRKSFADLI